MFDDEKTHRDNSNQQYKRTDPGGGPGQPLVVAADNNKSERDKCYRDEYAGEPHKFVDNKHHRRLGLLLRDYERSLDDDDRQRYEQRQGVEHKEDDESRIGRDVRLPKRVPSGFRLLCVFLDVLRGECEDCGEGYGGDKDGYDRVGAHCVVQTGDLEFLQILPYLMHPLLCLLRMLKLRLEVVFDIDHGFLQLFCGTRRRGTRLLLRLQPSGVFQQADYLIVI